MAKAHTDVALTELADEAYAAGEMERALQRYAALLLADPSDHYAWYRTALALAAQGQRDLALPQLTQACEALAESGQALLAIGAATHMLRLDEVAARRLAQLIGRLYGSDSQRLAGDRRPPPPTPPREVSGESEALQTSGRALVVLAEEACLAAGAAWAKQRDAAVPLPFYPLLSELSGDDLAELIPLMQSRTLGAQSVVIEQGGEGRSLFIVVRGAVAVDRDGVQLAYLRSGSFFGEMALLTNSPRTASVTAQGPVVLFELSRDALEDLAARCGGVAHVLAEHTRQRLLGNLMATSPLFAPVDVTRRKGLMELFTSTVYGGGQTIIAEGRESEGLHVVLSGQVTVTKLEGDETLNLATLGAGDLFGEISLIQRRPATASVTAQTKAVVLCLSREAFNAHVADFPEVIAHVYKLAVERDQANLQMQQAAAIDLTEFDESPLF